MYHRLAPQELRQPLLGAVQRLLAAPGVLQGGKDLLQAAITCQYVTALLARADMALHGLLQGRVCLIEGRGNQGIFLEAARKGGSSLLHTVSLTVRSSPGRCGLLFPRGVLSNAVRI